MAKIIEEKVKSEKEFINREDYEYALKNTFFNATIVVATVSVYATLAYAIVSFLKSKTKE